MSEKYVTLLGAEQVQTAANTMREAAGSMQRAADSISFSLQQHQQFMTDWLDRLTVVLEGRKTLK